MTVRAAHASLAVFAAAACALLAGCGQKGPLYLPEQTGTVVTRPGRAEAPPAPVEDDSSEDGAQKPK